MDAAAVVLTIVIVTGAGKPDIRHNEPMPDVKTCMQEAERVLVHEFPEFMGAEAVFAGCKAPAVATRPS